MTIQKLPDDIICAPCAPGACTGNGNHKGCDGKCHSAVALNECGICEGDGSVCRVEGLFGLLLQQCVLGLTKTLRVLFYD